MAGSNKPKTTDMQPWDLICDIGGTNARFGAARGGVLGDIHSINSDDFDAALARYIKDHGSAPRSMGISAAGAKQGDKITLTNADLVLDGAALGAYTQSGQCVLLNDFAAAAWFIDAPDARKSTCIYDAPYEAAKPAIMVGMGTGLGVGTYIPGKPPRVLQGEGGHVSVMARDRDEHEIFTRIAKNWPQVVIDKDAMILEAESILSGLGIVALYHAISNQEADLSPAQVMARAKQNDPVARQTLAMISWHLGRIVGDLALSLMARGGIFLTGGVLQKNPDILDKTFLRALQAGGRFTALRQSFPIYLCDDPLFGLIGMMRALHHKSARY